MSLKRNTVWNLAGNGMPFLLGIITIPYLITHLGVESFGILTLIWSLIGYFSLFDFGLGRALTQQVAARLAVGNENNILSLVKSGTVFTALTGLLGGLLLIALAQPLAYKWMNVSPELNADTMRCFLIAAIGIPLTTTSTGLRGVLEAYEDFKVVNLIKIGLGIASFGLPALVVMFVGASLSWIVVTLVAARFIALLAHGILVTQKLNTHWWRNKSSAADVKNLLSFGVWMTVTNIIGPLMVTADRFVISAILGAGTVAYYTIPSEALVRVLIIPTAVSVSLFPRLAMQFSTDLQKARALYVRSIKIVTLLLAPVCLLIAVGSYWGLSIWLGSTFAERSWMIVCVMSLGVFLNGIAFVPFAAIQAKGNSKKTAQLHIVEFILYVPLLVAALHLTGILGAAVIWTVRAGLDLVCLMLMAQAEMGSP